MDAVDRSQLLQLLHDRREAIAERWHQAIAVTSPASLDPAEGRQRLAELIDRVAALLLAEPFDRTEAHAIGAALARFDSLRPEVLGGTQEVLARQLLEGLPAEQVVALQPRLAVLLGGLATGFLRQACEDVLAGQERIQRALAAELYRSGQVLRDTEETALALLNAPPDPMLLLEPDGTIIDLNEAAARGLGRSREELIGASALEMFPPDVAQHRRTQGEQVISAGQPVRFEDQRGGRWFDQSVYPILDAHGEAVRLAVIARDVTEQRLAEQQLRESEAQAWALLNAPVDPMLLLYPDGTIVDLNEAAAQSLGKSRDELIGACALDMFPPEVAQRRRIRLEQVVLSGQRVRFEDQRAGRWFDQSVYPIFDAQGDVVRVAVIARDVTERKRAEQQLRESEAQAKALLNAPTDVAVLMDLDGTIVAHNQALAQRMGRSMSELIGLCAFDLLPSDVAERRKAYWNQVVRSGQPVRFEDQREGMWLDNHLYPVLDAQGEVVQIACFSRDVTERKRIGEALRESELRYRTFFESVPLGVGLATPDGRVLMCNDAMAEMTGYSREEFSQINLADTYRNPDVRAPLLKQLQTGGAVRGFEVELVRKDGVPYFASLTITPLTLDGEDVVLTLAQDITEQRQMERQLLLTERLAAVGRFAAGLAHEINNPLQAIRSNLELVLDFDLEPDERQTQLHVVRQEIENLVHITRQALGIAQPADDTRYPVNIADVARRSLTLLDRHLEQAHVRVTTDFPTDLPRVLAAPNQIGQVLLNLTVNAIEAMPEGGHVHLAARVDGDMVALAVSNDGPAIPAEHIDNVFDAFFTTKPEGSGLGLTISYRIVEQHGGRIRVENLGDDRGVVLTVTLPIAHLARRQETSA